ncbi:MAG: beta strand repeat-containing protein [bacterium]
MATSVSPIDSELNALYVGLFDRPADPSGQAYWANLPDNSAVALSSANVNSIGNFATYDYGTSTAAPLSDSNIAGEIVNIYSDLFGASVTVTNPGVQYWASQYITGAMSIGQIVNSIYNIVSALPVGSPHYIDTETMNAKLGASEQFTQSYASSGITPSRYGYAGATSQLNNGYTQYNFSNHSMPTNITTSMQTAYVPVSPAAATGTYQAASGNYSFVGGTAGPDTLNLGGPPSSVYTYSIAGGTGANTVDVNYAGVTAADLAAYLGSASGFQTLDFTTAPSAPLILNLSAVDAGGFTTIQNASGNEIFNVNANTNSLTISDATGQTVANVALGGDVTLGTLDTNLASPAAANPTTVDITSNGTTPNVITNLDVAAGSTVNITGSESLTLTNAASTPIPTYDYATFLGTSLIINGTQEISPSAPQTTITLAGGTVTYGNANYIFNITSTSTANTLTAGYGFDTVNIASGNNTTNTITLDHTTPGPGNNDAIYSAGTGAITATLGMSGATGNDTISMTGANTAADTFTITSTGTDSVYMTGASTAGNTITITGGTGTDTVSMTGGNSAANKVTVVGGTGAVNVTMTGGNHGGNTINISGSGTDTVLVGQSIYTINLGAVSGNAGTTGPVAVSIGQGGNTITFGTGADSLNMTTVYTGTVGANTLNGVIAGDTLVFNHSADTAAAVLTTTATTATTQTALGTAGSATTVAEEITALQAIDNVAGFTTVGWIQPTTADTFVVMNHALTATTWVDQVIEIVGAPAYIISTTGVSVNSTTHLVNVAL